MICQHNSNTTPINMHCSCLWLSQNTLYPTRLRWTTKNRCFRLFACWSKSLQQRTHVLFHLSWISQWAGHNRPPHSTLHFCTGQDLQRNIHDFINTISSHNNPQKHAVLRLQYTFTYILHLSKRNLHFSAVRWSSVRLVNSSVCKRLNRHKCDSVNVSECYLSVSHNKQKLHYI